MEIASIISFIHANLQHIIAAYRVLCRTVSVNRSDMGLIQEPWYRECRIRGLNIPGYILFSATGLNGLRASIRTRKETVWMLPGFSCRGLVADLMKYNDDVAERRFYVPHIYPTIAKIHPR